MPTHLLSNSSTLIHGTRNIPGDVQKANKLIELATIFILIMVATCLLHIRTSVNLTYVDTKILTIGKPCSVLNT